MRPLTVVAVLVFATSWIVGPQRSAPRASAANVRTRATVGVTMRHNRFHPHQVVVRLGQTVRWTNRDSVAHTVASAKLRLSSEAIRAGRSSPPRPRRRARFAYYCTIHFGQTGVLVVR